MYHFKPEVKSREIETVQKERAEETDQGQGQGRQPGRPSGSVTSARAGEGASRVNGESCAGRRAEPGRPGPPSGSWGDDSAGVESRPRGTNVTVTPQATLPGRGMQPREEQALDLRRRRCAVRARSPCARSCGSWARAPRASSCTAKERSAHEGNPRGHRVPAPSS